MKHIQNYKTFESWDFFKRKTPIEKLDNEDISKYDYEDLKDNIRNNWKNYVHISVIYGTYGSVNRSSNESMYYFYKLIDKYKKLVESLYRFFRFLTMTKTQKLELFFLERLERITNHIQSFNGRYSKKYYKVILGSVSLLNIMNYHIGEYDLIINGIDNKQPNYKFSDYKYLTKTELTKIDKIGDKNNDIDPFGEEYWGEDDDY